MNVLSIICREPYRLFFPLGIIMGMVGVSHWFFYAQGFIQEYSNFFHALVQIMTYMNCFVVGFLLTAMPRFSQTPHASKAEVFFFLFIIIGTAIFLAQKQWIVAELCYMVFLLGLIRFAFSRISKKKSGSTSNPPKELIWVPIGVMHGLVGSLLLILGQIRVLPNWAILIGKPMVEQGFLLSVVIGVGGFLIPRMMGTHRRADPEEKICSTDSPGLARLDKDVSVHLCMGLLLFLSFFLEGFQYERLAYGLKALVMTVEFFYNQSFLHIPRSKDLYVKLAWMSLWMVALGFWLASFFPQYRIAALHLAYLGGFSLMTFAVGTMVVMSHAGQVQELHSRLWILWVVGAAVALSLVKRWMVTIFPDLYFKLLGLSATFWMAGAVSWLVFITPRIFKVPAEDAFGQMHERVKQELGKR